MKKTLKITALILMSLMLMLTFASCGTPSVKSTDGTCGDDLKWAYDSDKKTLTVSGSGTMTNFENSEKRPFAQMRYVTEKIVVEDGVESIGDYAFYEFFGLKEVSLPETLKSVGNFAFAYSTKVTSIVLPESLTSIGDSAFEGCSLLNAAFIPSNVEKLGTNVFAYCYSVTDAAVLANIAIPSGTFTNCRSIERIVLRNTIKESDINPNAFTGCSVSFKDATFTESIKALANVTVNYVDTKGNVISDPQTKENLEYGASYSFVSPSIEGYTADELTVTGYVHGENVTRKVTYTKDPVVETEVTEAPSVKDKMNASTIIPIVVLVVVLVGIGVGAYFIIRSEKNNSNKSSSKNNANNKNAKKRK